MGAMNRSWLIFGYSSGAQRRSSTVNVAETIAPTPRSAKRGSKCSQAGLTVPS